jgi:hypothetical protein
VSLSKDIQTAALACIRAKGKDYEQAIEFLKYLLGDDNVLTGSAQHRPPSGFYGRSIGEMIADQPDGFATE